MKSLSGSTLRDVLRRSFGFLPAVGILAGLVLGFVLPVVDRALRIDFGIFSFTERDSARSLLETIASVTVSVAGVGFSVTIVAFTLASQQLSPRVLRTFQSDRLSQALLGAFLGTFAFCLVVLATLDAGGEALPDLSLAVAVLGAIASFALFVAFIQNAVVSLQASTLIRRMAADGQASIDRRFPAVIGADPADPQEALRRVRERMADGDGLAVRAGRAGFLTELKGEELFEAVRPADALVEQCLPLGDFVLTGGLLARVWPAPGGGRGPRGPGRERRRSVRAGRRANRGLRRRLPRAPARRRGAARPVALAQRPDDGRERYELAGRHPRALCCAAGRSCGAHRCRRRAAPGRHAAGAGRPRAPGLRAGAGEGGHLPGGLCPAAGPAGGGRAGGGRARRALRRGRAAGAAATRGHRGQRAHPGRRGGRRGRARAGDGQPSDASSADARSATSASATTS